MELWIRNQDKDSLVKVEKIELNYDYLCCDDIQLIHIETDKGRIGSYSTKERALEVLDEIQKLIKPKTFINMESFNANDARVLCDKFKEYSPIIVGNDNIKIEPLSFIVYEMPKE